MKPLFGCDEAFIRAKWNLYSGAMKVSLFNRGEAFVVRYRLKKQHTKVWQVEIRKQKGGSYFFQGLSANNPNRQEYNAMHYRNKLTTYRNNLTTYRPNLPGYLAHIHKPHPGGILMPPRFGIGGALHGALLLQGASLFKTESDALNLLVFKLLSRSALDALLFREKFPVTQSFCYAIP